VQLDLLTQVAQRYAPLILLAYMVCICIEISVDYLLKTKLYNFDDTLQNLMMFFVNRMTGGLGGAFMFSMLALAEHFSLWKFHGMAGWIATFLIVDFLFFVQHRVFHTDSILAPFHEIHHTSQHYNLTTTLRASIVLPWINPLFYFPAVIVGCDPLAVILCFSLIQVYQFFLHTQYVPSLGILEGFFNTPSAHRVHHGDLPSQYGSNLGGVLVIWDRIFGTYMPEPEQLTYGVRGVPMEKNFFVAQVKPFSNYFKRWMKQIERERT
jgi:sterol desaturase/sphingolipid hydroxylase (fatty acid hydroxylase superfamily)